MKRVESERVKSEERERERERTQQQPTTNKHRCKEKKCFKRRTSFLFLPKGCAVGSQWAYWGLTSILFDSNNLTLKPLGLTNTNKGWCHVVLLLVLCCGSKYVRVCGGRERKKERKKEREREGEKVALRVGLRIGGVALAWLLLMLL